MASNDPAWSWRCLTWLYYCKLIPLLLSQWAYQQAGLIFENKLILDYCFFRKVHHPRWNETKNLDIPSAHKKKWHINKNWEQNLQKVAKLKMPKSRGRTSTETRAARYHLEATPPPRQGGLFHHGSLSSADSGSLNHFGASFSHPTSPLLANHRGTAARRAGSSNSRLSNLHQTVVNENGIVTLQISENDSDQPVYQVS